MVFSMMIDFKEPQVRSIADHVRPDRQCLLFSATFKKKVERLGKSMMGNEIFYRERAILSF